MDLKKDVGDLLTIKKKDYKVVGIYSPQFFGLEGEVALGFLTKENLG